MTIIVDWIDKIAPTAEIKYEKQANGSILAEVVNANEHIIFGEDGGKFLFTQNGTYTFIIEDEAGNKTELIAKVDTIEAGISGTNDDAQKHIIVLMLSIAFGLLVAGGIVTLIVIKKQKIKEN